MADRSRGLDHAASGEPGRAIADRAVEHPTPGEPDHADG